MISEQPTYRFRSVFLSDIHLGYHGCRAELLLQFLRAVRTENLYLVGDIIDVISLKDQFYWPQPHNDVVRTLLGKTKHGTRVVYIPGNHDAQFRDYCGLRFGHLEIRRRCIHVGADGKRYLVTHGDEFDGYVTCSRWQSVLGALAYRRLLYLNSRFNQLRMRLGYNYWSLASFLKHRSGSARRYIERFRLAATDAAKKRRVDGIVCGHIHRPERANLGSTDYLNTGDWVDNCTALVETADGRMRLIDWPRVQAEFGRTETASLRHAA